MQNPKVNGSFQSLVRLYIGRVSKGFSWEISSEWNYCRFIIILFVRCQINVSMNIFVDEMW